MIEYKRILPEGLSAGEKIACVPFFLIAYSIAFDMGMYEKHPPYITLETTFNYVAIVHLSGLLAFIMVLFPAFYLINRGLKQEISNRAYFKALLLVEGLGILVLHEIYHGGKQCISPQVISFLLHLCWFWLASACFAFVKKPAYDWYAKDTSLLNHGEIIFLFLVLLAYAHSAGLNYRDCSVLAS